MKNKLIYAVVLVVFGVACGGGDNGQRRGQKNNFEVVQEGAASGVTSTIQGPGESLPPATGSSADTTTAFTIDPNVSGTAATAPVAGTMPAPSYSSAGSSLPAMTSAIPQPRTEPRDSAVRSPEPERTPAAQPAEPAPAESEPAVEPQQPVHPAPATSTAAPAEQQDDEPQDEPDPPPTTTDTRGQ